VRRLVTKLIHAHSCPYVVHLEDNESAIVDGRSDPARIGEFLAGAAGVTVVIDRLLELKPAHVPGAVVWPGFDEAILSPRRSREDVRRLLELDDSDVVIVYPGNIQASNLEDVRSLYEAILRLRSSGFSAVLVKTGWDFVHRSSLPALGSSIRELGWVAREHVPGLLSAADVLVQPGQSDPYNDYRFPSKLPEFLATSKPVVLPRTNIGLHLQDGAEALLLDRGDATEIAEKVARLAADAELRAELGEGGRAFALRELRWSRNVDRVVDLYTGFA
jgi:glycosyltransferase involved in cell wall biosynthesis